LTQFYRLIISILVLKKTRKNNYSIISTTYKIYFDVGIDFAYMVMKIKIGLRPKCPRGTNPLTKEEYTMAKNQTSKGVTVAKSNPIETSIPVAIVPAPIPAPTTFGELWERLDARLTAIEKSLEGRTTTRTGKGLVSTRSMTEADAIRVMIGDLETKAIKECAKELGLSYGQIYSARGGYTFKTQYAEKMEKAKAAKK